MLNKELLEQQLMELPLFQYAFMKTEELTFTERVRHICREECPRYGTTWACPPAVGAVDSCKAQCLAYPEMLMISTVTEVNDIENVEETLNTRGDHEEITRQVADLLKQQGCELRVLSTESCAICEECSYPNGPCRHPDLMFPCVESQGILVTEICEKYGMEFFNGNIVTWFSLILYR
jgi:predicted metal-binding protein